MKISEFQKLIRNLYLDNDSKRGIERTFIWLVEEIGELANIFNKRNYEKKLISEELADIIAWSCSIANLLDIDIEEAIVEKYPNKCLRCSQNPCICEM
jgi:NTP pyrophosphatase (non-canonical NTP hydrolase)